MMQIREVGRGRHVVEFSAETISTISYLAVTVCLKQLMRILAPS